MAKVQANNWTWGLLGVVAGFLGGILFAQSAVNNNQTGVMSMMGFRTQSTVVATDSLDRHFIEQMIPHHQDAITMAKVAQVEAKHSEIKQLASAIITAQNQEIEQMKVWYRDWFGVEVPQTDLVMGGHGMSGTGELHMGMMGNDTDILRLEDAADFDRAFIEEMIPHHQMAVMMANMLLANTTRPELQKLARDIVKAQTREIEEMRQWYQIWYES